MSKEKREFRGFLLAFFKSGFHRQIFFWNVLLYFLPIVLTTFWCYWRLS